MDGRRVADVAELGNAEEEEGDCEQEVVERQRGRKSSCQVGVDALVRKKKTLERAIDERSEAMSMMKVKLEEDEQRRQF